MQETEGVALRIGQVVPVGPGRLQQPEGADDIGLNKVFRTVNGTIHVRFGGEIDDGANRVFAQQVIDQFGIANVAFNEDMSRVRGDGLQVLPVPRVGQFVQIDDGFVSLPNPIDDEIGPNEASSASH